MRCGVVPSRRSKVSSDRINRYGGIGMRTIRISGITGTDCIAAPLIVRKGFR